MDFWQQVRSVVFNHWRFYKRLFPNTHFKYVSYKWIWQHVTTSILQGWAQLKYRRQWYLGTLHHNRSFKKNLKKACITTPTQFSIWFSCHNSLLNMSNRLTCQINFNLHILRNLSSQTHSNNILLLIIPSLTCYSSEATLPYQ